MEEHSEWRLNADKHLDEMFDRLRKGLPISEDPEFRKKCEIVAKFQAENPITDIKAWAKKLAEESAKFND